MKTKTIFFVALAIFFISSLIFSQHLKAQTQYVEAIKFQKYGASTIQYRYDNLHRLTLATTPFERDSINITTYTYDAMGNRTSKTVFFFYKDKEDKEKYICNIQMDFKKFSEMLKNIFHQLDDQ